MAHDVKIGSANFPLEELNHLADTSVFTPIGYDLEPELKFSILNPHNIRAIRPTTQTPYSNLGYQGRFTQIMDAFNNAAINDPTKGSFFSIIDANGITPRDYVLVSLGQDTHGKTMPTYSFRQEGFQYRERFAVKAFGNNPEIIDCDACAKTLLSSLKEGRHREEFERACSSPRTTYQEFRQIPNLPEFFHKIDPKTLFVDSVCLTSRTSFFSLTHIPGTNILALLEHSCDVSRFATPFVDAFIGTVDDIEWEAEIKGFYGTDQRLPTKKGQIELVNKLFDHLTPKMEQANSGIKRNTNSKMERAAQSVHEHYLESFVRRSERQINQRQTNYCNRNNIPLGLAHALGMRVSALSIHEDPRLLIKLAQAMPDPRTFLNTNNQFFTKECA
ncbi:MAG: hypothetical protein IAE63_06575 [Alphaproteobacteria bacterium]|nr:hypothetical protein [Alphaproteobacteria bacterium]